MYNIFNPNMTISQVNELPTLTVAHIGDGVYELLVRTYIAQNYALKVSAVHKKTVALVRAEAQARATQHIKPLLTDDELAVFTRGRNAKSYSVPKNSSIAEYSQATAFETLLGMLYLTGRHERIGELFEIIVKQELSNESN